MNPTTSLAKNPARVVDAELLRRFAPLSELDAPQLDHLADSSRIEFARRNETLFAAGTTTDRALYLLDGTITLLAGGKPVESFQAGSERASRPIFDGAPAGCVAHADANLTLLSLDKRAAGQMKPVAQSQTSKEPIDQAQWLKLFLRSNAFLKLPAGNLQTLVSRMEEVPVRAGQVIIHQGGNANNYYIVKSGHCRVLRQIPGSEHPIELAALGAGEGFGEDALITRGRRNASVIMTEDGALMRLSRHNFTNILVNPLLNSLSLTVALQKANGDAVLLDVRAPNEFRRDGLEHAINIPLPLLRANLDKLDIDRPHIAYCNSGNLSAAAAFLLAQRGITSHVIAGGIRKSAHADDAPAALKKITRAAPKAKTTPKPKSIKAKAAPGPKPQTPPPAPAPTITTDTPLYRDELQLWTSIPTTENVTPAALRVVDATPTIHSMRRNTAIRCIETQQDVAAVATEMAQTTPRPSDKTDHAVHLGWVSDHYMWETTLGYRRDARIEAALGMDTGAGNSTSGASLSIQPRHDDPGHVPETSKSSSVAATASDATALGVASVARAQTKRRIKRLVARGVVLIVLTVACATPWLAPHYWTQAQQQIGLLWSQATRVPQPAATVKGVAPTTPPAQSTRKPAPPTAKPTDTNSNAAAAPVSAPTSPEGEMMSIF